MQKIKNGIVRAFARIIRFSKMLLAAWDNNFQNMNVSYFFTPVMTPVGMASTRK